MVCSNITHYIFIINFTILGFPTKVLLKGAITSVGTVVSSFRSNDNQRLTDQVLAAYNLIGLDDQQLMVALSNMRVPGQEEFASFIHIKDASVIFIYPFGLLLLRNLHLNYLQGKIIGPFQNPIFQQFAAFIRARISFEQDKWAVSNEELSHNGKNLDGGFRASNIQAALIVSPIVPTLFYSCSILVFFSRPSWR